VLRPVVVFHAKGIHGDDLDAALVADFHNLGARKHG
jgi:hypothetical protein